MTLELSPQQAGTNQPSSPYPGLMPFTEADADFFFGRESEVRLIANTAKARRLCVLYGPSGVGKSSVLQAGVLRQIRDENTLRYERFGAVETVVAYLKEWRDDPFAALLAAVRDAFATMPGATPLAEQSSQDVVEEILSLRSARTVDLVLILDQFEEFFLYHRDRVDDFAQLLDALTERGTRVNLLISLREDALALLDEFQADVPAVLNNRLGLEHLDAKAAEAAIRRPLDHYNTQVPESERVGIEDGLVKELLSQVRTGRVQVDSSQELLGPRSGEDEDATLRVEAPYLQLVLSRLWDQERSQGSSLMRLATLHELGGAQRIVEQHLDRVMREFSPPEMAVLADAFGQLVTPSGSKIAHRAGDLAGFSGRDPAQMAALLLRLAEGRHLILRELPPPIDEPHAEPRYEIFHDVLALAVLDWRRRFLAEAGAVRQQAELVAQKEEAALEARETRRRLRRARLIVSVMGVLVLFCAGLVWWALDARGDARTAESGAKTAASEAEAATAKQRQERVLADVNRKLLNDPSGALVEARSLKLDGAHDEDGRAQVAMRRALDAADTDVELKLGSAVVLAEFDADENVVTVTEDGHVRVWEVTQQDPMRLDDEPMVDSPVVEEGTERVLQAVMVGVGGSVVTMTDAGSVASVDLASGEVVDLTADVTDAISLSTAEYGDRDFVLVGTEDSRQVLVDVATHKVVTFPGLQHAVDSAAVDVSGSYLAVVTADERVQLWDLAEKTKLAETVLETHTNQTLQFGTVSFTDSPDTPILLLLATGWKTEASVWDALNTDVPVPLGQGEEGEWRQVYDNADVWSWGAKASEQYSGLVAIAGNKEVRLFDSRGKDVGTMNSQTVAMNDWATGVEVNPGDTSIFAVASNEGQVELYRLHTFTPPRPLWTFRGHSGTVNQLRWSKDGTNLVTASQDGTVRVWRVPTAKSLWWSPDWVLASTFTADGNYLMGFTPGGYVVRSDPRVKSDLEPLGLVNAFVSTGGQLNDMSPSPDGQRAVVLTTYCDPPIRIDMSDDDPAQVNLDTPDGTVSCPTRIAWNPSAGSQQVVAGTTDGRVIVWDADTKTVVDTGQLDSSAPVLAIDFSGDGTRLVVTTAGVEGRRIYVLNASDLSRVRDWRASDVDRLDVSYDGDYVATAGNDSHRVRVWDVEDADAPSLELAGTAGTLSSVTLSQDETASRVAASTSEGLVYVWSRDTGQILAILRTHSDATNQAAFDPDDINRIVSAGDDGEMTEITCEVCAADADGLDELAEQREVQVIELK